LELWAKRPLPGGLAACLPQERVAGSSISDNGRWEVIQRTFDIPASGDPSRATVEDVIEGVVVHVPLRKRKPHARREVSLDSETMPRPTPPPSPKTAAPLAADEVQMKATEQVVVLPSSEGLLIEEEAWPEVQKDEDASEGWWDNRGEFQYY
jgi:hypothetical protein